VKLKYKAVKGSRKKKGYIRWLTQNVTTGEYKLHRARTFLGITSMNTSLWWCHESKKWLTPEQAQKTPLLKRDLNGNALFWRTTHYNGCKSVRAFRKLLKRWRIYLPAGVEFTLASRFPELEVVGRI